MKLTLIAIVVSLLVGFLAAGRLSNLAATRIRWSLLAPVGLALQVLPVHRHVLSMALLFVSFIVLSAFAIANIRLPGFVLILAGLALNFSVIAANGGMPVTRHALEASGQSDTLSLLIREGGAKHHLATSSDVLLPLADAIPIRGIDQAVSAGDLATYSGVTWLIVACMRRRRRPAGHRPGEDASVELEVCDARR